MQRRLGGEQLVNGGDYVAHRPDALEFLRLDALAGHLLQPDREVDRVDAVQVEIVEQVRVERHPLRVDLEIAAQDGLQLLEYLRFRHLPPSGLPLLKPYLAGAPPAGKGC